MDELVKLKMNIMSLIRLSKAELEDSIEDLKANQERIKYYESQNSPEAKQKTKQFRNLEKIYINIIIHNNRVLLNYYDEINKLNDVKRPGEDFRETYNSNHLKEIDKMQHILESSICSLEDNVKKSDLYNKLFKDLDVEIIFSQNEYYAREVIRNYDKLNQTKLEYYKERYPNILMKKYN